jgi:hypothetical protein
MEESVREWSEWWLPGGEEHPAVGEVRFSASDGPTITLFQLPPGLHPTGQSHSTLLGRTFDGTKLTLLEAIVTSQEVQLGGGSSRIRIDLRGSVLLRGGHRDDGATLPVQRARVRFEGLRNLCLIESVVDDRPVSFLQSAVGARRQITVDGGSLTFETLELGSTSKFGRSSELEVSVLVEANDEVPLGEFEERWLMPIQGLVMFASREPSVMNAWTLLLADLESSSYHPAVTHGMSAAFWAEEPVEVLTATPGLVAEASANYERPLVPLGALTSGVDDFIASWFRLYAELGQAALTLMSALGSRLFLDNKLLNEVSFAESYHRIKHDQPTVPADDHERHTAAMLSVVPDANHRDHYKQILRYAAQQTARRRLKWLVARAAEVLPDVEWLKPRLANDLVDTRNSFAHLDPSSQPPLTAAKLYYGIARLEVVLQANLLLDLGIDSSLVRQLLMISYRNQIPFVVFDD